MRGFCAKCGRTFSGQMLCPLCGVQLDNETGAANPAVAVRMVDDTPDGPSFVRRLAFGLITLLGLYHGLKHLALAGVLAQTGVPALSPDGHLSLLIVSTLAASIAAGTVNRRAEATGLLLALAGAGGFLGSDVLRGDLPDEWLFGVPTLLALVAVVGGFAGRLMVPPAPRLPTFGRLDSRVVVRMDRKQPPVSWPQIIAGAGLTIFGTAYADSIRHGIAKIMAGDGGSFGARPLIAWQIGMLAALAGGVVSGLRTRAGFRQAFFAGLVAGVGVVVVLLTTADGKSPVLDFWNDQLGIKAGSFLPCVALGLTTAISTWLGSWLGSHLAPSHVRK
jgi:hypothetical protein